MMHTSSIFQSQEEFNLLLQNSEMPNNFTANSFEPLQITTTISPQQPQLQPQQQEEIIARSSSSLPFPWRVHELLSDAEKEGFTSIVSWLPDFAGFKVHKTKVFEKQILPRYFKQTKYKSFRRQLNIWGFHRSEERPHKGGYWHPSFVRGRPTLCHNMKRTQIKGGDKAKLAKAIKVTKKTTSIVGEAKATIEKPCAMVSQNESISCNTPSGDVPSVISIPSVPSMCSDPLFDDETLSSVLPKLFHGCFLADVLSESNGRRYNKVRSSSGKARRSDERLELSLFLDQ